MTLHIALGAALIITKGQAAPEVEHTYTHARALCQQVGETSQLAPVLLGLWRFYLMVHSCTRRASSGKPYCAWHNVPTTPRSRSSPTMPLGLHGLLVAHCRLPASTWRKASPSTRQTSAVLRCSAWATIRVLPAVPMPL